MITGVAVGSYYSDLCDGDRTICIILDSLKHVSIIREQSEEMN